MINVERFNEIFAKFKENFTKEHWNDEKFKWEAVKRFQDIWDINAPDFLDMFMRATDKTYSLLASMSNFPRGMIKEFATADPEFVRSMFINLFDKSKDLASRFDKFVSDAEEIRIKYDPGTWKNHYQNANAISTYLWLRYPDKYYIYKYSECRAVAKELSNDFMPRKGKFADNIIGGKQLYDDVCKHLQRDEDMKRIMSECITDSCYPDPQMRTLTIDFGFYISRYLYDSETVNIDGWWPSLKDYNPELTKEDWKKYINEAELPNHASPIKMLIGMMNLGGEASCKKLSSVYGGSPYFYVGCAMNLGRRVKKYFNLSACMDEDKERYFTIPFLGKKGVGDEYIYRIRPELFEALKEIDLSNISPEYKDEQKMNCNYWWLNANPKIWSFSDIKIGEIQGYTLYNSNGNKRRVFQNFLDAKEGDIVIGYESTPVKQIQCICRIAEENDGESLYFEKVENLSTPISYASLKDCSELANMEYFVNPQGSLFMKMNYLTSAFPKFLERHGLRRMRFHDLRHSCASLLLANGVPLKHIQEWLGHSDFTTTANIYAHLDYSSKITSAQAMETGLALPESGNFTSKWEIADRSE